MKKKSLGDILFAVLFVGLLLAVMLTAVLREKGTTSYYENRTLAQRPALTAASVLSGTYFSALDTYLSDQAPLRGTISKLSTWADIYLLRRPVVNNIVVSADMLLAYTAFATLDAEEVTAEAESMADSLSALSELVEGYGGHYYHVAVPGQGAYYVDRYPDYVNSRADYYVAEREAFSDAMADRRVDLLDMGDVFEALGNPEDYYSPVDHHYTYYGAFAAYQAIMGHINESTGYDLHIYSDADFSFEEVEGYRYMGSRLRPIFGLVDLNETLVIGSPEEDVPFTRYDRGAEVEPTVFNLTPDSMGNLSYTIYMGGDIPELCIDTNRPQLPTVLIYGDSYTNAVETLLYTGFDKMYSIDLRYYNETSLAEYIEALQPDVVLCIRDYSVLLSTDGNGTVFLK